MMPAYPKTMLMISCLLVMQCSKPFPDEPVWFLWQSIYLQSLDTKKYIFLSSQLYTGNLGGVSGADAICSSEKNTNFSSLPGDGSEYLALLDDGSSRMACQTNPNCTAGVSEHQNWVLSSSTDYYLSTGVKVFTTNAVAIINYSNGEKLDIALGSSANHWWSGMDENWQNFLDCSNWSAAAVVSGSYGLSNTTTNDAIGSNFLNKTCNNSAHVLCVRQ